MINLLSSLLHLFYPHTCEGCGTDLSSTEEILCLSCMRQLPVTGFQHHTNNPVARIFYGRAKVLQAMAAYYYVRSTLLQRLIYQFKYHRREDIALFLGRQAGHLLLQSQWIHEITGIVPVPMTAARERQRGYNQAAVLANGIAAVTGKPVINNILARTDQRTSQTTKNRLLRWQNVTASFMLKAPTLPSGQHVLLVDDVITTGATTETCCRLLYDAGASVSVCSLAYAHH